MKLWMLKDPNNYNFAQAARIGSWSESDGLCSECGSTSQVRIQPLIIEWEAGSDEIGDFTWVGFGSDIIVKYSVLNSLDGIRGFEPGLVRMVENPSLHRPKNTRREKPRVRMPYLGPPLSELWITSYVNIDLEKSNVRKEHVCGTCGRIQFIFDGFDRKDSKKQHYKGISIHKGLLNGNEIFRTHEFPSWVLCTDYFKSIVEMMSFCNVSFTEIGELI
jgi:hypothetical protein